MLGFKNNVNDSEEYVIMHKVYTKKGNLKKVDLVTNAKTYKEINNYLFSLNDLCKNEGILLRDGLYKKVDIVDSALYCSYLLVELSNSYEVFKIVKI